MSQEEANTTQVPDIDPSKFGYDLYPQRWKKREQSVSDMLLGRNLETDRIKCEHRVYDCLKTNRLVRLMMSALKNSGCPIDIRRHIACEPCDKSVTGGYDPVMNQIVVCNETSKNIVPGVLAHEMIHMFDYCVHKVDFKNIDHVACTEIRAANLTHCSFMSAFMQGDVTPFNFKNLHQDCVKTKALHSILAVRDVTEEEAVAVIERVFPKCYADLEPIGRRLKRGSNDIDKAYREGFYYGYV